MLTEHPELLNARWIHGETVLHFLAIEGFTEGVRFLAARGADVNAVNEFGDTALVDVGVLGLTEIADILLSHGASPDAQSEVRENPLHATVLLADLRKARHAATSRPRSRNRTSKTGRYVAAAVKREVWARGGGQCAFVGAAGRCTERGFLEYHHVIPFVDGGETDVSNLQLAVVPTTGSKRNDGRAPVKRISFARSVRSTAAGRRVSNWVPAGSTRQLSPDSVQDRVRAIRLSKKLGAALSRQRPMACGSTRIVRNAARSRPALPSEPSQPCEQRWMHSHRCTERWSFCATFRRWSTRSWPG
jgi:hypothetical protein